jgi:hypothetical protein
MVPTLQDRCRSTILGTLALHPYGLTLPRIYRVIADDLPGLCSRQDVANVIEQLESDSVIDYEFGFNRGTRKIYFVPPKLGGRARIVPAGLAPLPAMPKSTWFTALGVMPVEPEQVASAPTWAAALFPAAA